MPNRIEFYGVVICDIIVLFIIFYTIIKLLGDIKIITNIIQSLSSVRESDLHDIKKEIRENNETLFSRLLYEYKLNISSTKEHSYNDLYAILKRIHDISNSSLYDAMHDIKAIRLAIYLFHNGSHTLNGFSFLKVSCIGEKILSGSGVREKILLHSNLMANLCESIYDDIFTTGRSIIFNNNVVESEDITLFISSTTKTKYSQVASLYDNDNNVVGFILAEFNHDYNKVIADKEYDNIKCLSDKLSPIFSFTDYANLTTNTQTSDDK